MNQPGRLRADGTRAGAKTTRRTVLYLPIEVGDELEKRALAGRKSLTDCATEALAEQWGITLEAVS